MKRIKKYVYLGLMVGGIVVAPFLDAMELKVGANHASVEMEEQDKIDLSKQLYDAINQDDVELVRAALIAGADSNRFFCTADAEACQRRLSPFQMVLKILDFECDSVTYTNTFVIAQLLLAYGADVQSANKLLKFSNNVEIVKFLLDNGCIYQDREPLLRCKINTSTFEMVQSLIDRGVNVNEAYKDSIGIGPETALGCAIDRYKEREGEEALEPSIFAMIKALVAAGARLRADIDLRVSMYDRGYQEQVPEEVKMAIQEGLLEYDLRACDAISQEIVRHTSLPAPIAHLARDYTAPYISQDPVEAELAHYLSDQGDVVALVQEYEGEQDDAKEYVKRMRNRVAKWQQAMRRRDYKPCVSSLPTVCSSSESLPVCTTVPSSVLLEKQEKSEESRDCRMVVCDNCTAHNVHGAEKCVTCFHPLGN